MIRGLRWGCYLERDDGLQDQQGETATAIRSRLQQASDAKIAVTIGPGTTDPDFFLSRWNRTSAAEKAYLLRGIRSSMVTKAPARPICQNGPAENKAR